MEKIKTLVSMVDFVNNEIERLNVTFESDNKIKAQLSDNVTNYAKFLSQPLTLGMFIPVSVNNVPLEESMCNEGSMATGYYKECKSKALFEGVKLSGEYIITPEFDSLDIETFIGVFVEDLTIESLAGDKTNYKLTETALKQIYG